MNELMASTIFMGESSNETPTSSAPCIAAPGRLVEVDSSIGNSVTFTSFFRLKQTNVAIQLVAASKVSKVQAADPPLSCNGLFAVALESVWNLNALTCEFEIN